MRTNFESRFYKATILVEAFRLSERKNPLIILLISFFNKRWQRTVLERTTFNTTKFLTSPLMCFLKAAPNALMKMVVSSELVSSRKFFTRFFCFSVAFVEKSKFILLLIKFKRGRKKKTSRVFTKLCALLFFLCQELYGPQVLILLQLWLVLVSYPWLGPLLSLDGLLVQPWCFCSLS